MRAASLVEEIAARKKSKPGQIVLAWLLQKGDDVVPIPGTKRRSYLEENVAAAAEEEVIRCTLCADKLPPGSRRRRKLNVGNETWSGMHCISPRNLRRHCQEEFIHEPTCEKFTKERRAGFV